MLESLQICVNAKNVTNAHLNLDLNDCRPNIRRNHTLNYVDLILIANAYFDNCVVLMFVAISHFDFCRPNIHCECILWFTSTLYWLRIYTLIYVDLVLIANAYFDNYVDLMFVALSHFDLCRAIVDCECITLIILST